MRIVLIILATYFVVLIVEIVVLKLLFRRNARDDRWRLK